MEKRIYALSCDMASNAKVLHIFVSCPGDLDTERKVIEGILDDLNSSLFPAYGVLLQAIQWKRDIVPGVSSSAQEVINEQAMSKLDIYLGMLGTRFGSPTGRAGSGTEEEFDIALDRYRHNPSSIRLLFYFKNSAEDLSAIDPNQLKAIQEFRQKLTANGVLYSTFSLADDFLRSIKQHLTTLISDQWAGDDWKVSTKPLAQITSISVSSAELEQANLEEKEGYLEILLDQQESSRASNLSMVRIGELTGSFTSQLAVHTESLSQASAKDNIVKIKAVNDLVSEDLSLFARDLTLETAVFKASSIKLFDSVTRLLNVHLEDGYGDRAEMLELPAAMAALSVTIHLSREQLTTFRRTISSTPPATAKFRSAQRRANQALDDLIAVFTLYIEKLKMLQRDFEDRLAFQNSNEE